MKSRLFIAIPVDSALKNNILAWQKNNRSSLLRMIKPDNLHLTLIPPWYTDNPAEIIKKIKMTAIKIVPFNIIFSKIEIGPTLKNPRLVWLTGKCPTRLIQLKNTLEKNLDLNSEARSLIAHITLCRFKQADYPRLPKAKLKSEINWKLNIQAICLFESALTPDGAKYKKLIIKRFQPPKSI